MEMDYRNWEIEYISCEGNKRWTVARCPSHWEEYEVETAFRGICYGVGDDPAEFISCRIHYNHDYFEATYFLSSK